MPGMTGAHWSITVSVPQPVAPQLLLRLPASLSDPLGSVCKMGELVEGVSTYIRQCILMCVAERAGTYELTISFFLLPIK
ncbi:hypothetical protein XENTR_v10010833 [Xenopus tropicalis]|nr:hypothetical protein XENTR_v10010833 [Xenopus tropicalis]